MKCECSAWWIVKWIGRGGVGGWGLMVCAYKWQIQFLSCTHTAQFSPSHSPLTFHLSAYHTPQLRTYQFIAAKNEHIYKYIFKITGTNMTHRTTKQLQIAISKIGQVILAPYTGHIIKNIYWPTHVNSQISMEPAFLFMFAWDRPGDQPRI